MKHILLSFSIVLSMLATAPVHAIQQYLSADAFLAEVFNGQVPKPKLLWLLKDNAKQAEQILGHAPNQIRQRYWQQNGVTAWVLEEIGKEELITAGFVVQANKIVQVRVLTYRESRGWEVRHPAFLKQFEGLMLQPDRHLTRQVDGISGATLSVSAMSRMTRLALYLDALVAQESQS
ncbi:MAG: FMN-binding protein [Methylophilus sp.]|nr:FMN-binding protein [Methylophilus sp.]